MFSPTIDLDGAGFLNEFGKARAHALAAYRDTRFGGRIYRNYGVGLFTDVAVDHRSVPIERNVGIDHEAELTNDGSLEVISSVRLPGAWDTYETLDGTPFERPANLYLEIDWNTNPQQPLALTLSTKNYTNFRDPGWGTSIAATVTAQPLPRLELSIGPSLSWDPGALRFVDCSAGDGSRCVTTSGPRTYRFARLDAGSLSITGRAAVAFRPNLSFDLYSQLFFAQGDYHGYQVATITGATRLAHSVFMPLMTSGDERAALDADHDFASASLNINAVLRWDFREGSSLYAVYTRSQIGQGLAPESFPAIHPSWLSGGPQVDTVMVKTNLFWR